MPNIRRTFTKGIMNKDVDERLLDDGYYRHAENIIINTSENSDVGAIEKCLSNKQLTFLQLGNNIETVASYSDESKNKLYWWVVSSAGCFVFEYNYNNKIIYTLLSDNRLKKVLDLKRQNLITGISKIISEQGDKDMLLWTDNNMEICCINIERAKTYGLNGFEKEDIYLVKKPPYRAPSLKMTYDLNTSNNIEEKFISFAYRYKYLDGEYSALSPFTRCAFEPKSLEIDFDTQDNISMINRFNSVQLTFNTGDKRVVDIQLLAKESNSNTVYIIESFNKKKESLSNNFEKSITYSNNKLYKALSEKDFFKEYDNVPRKSKALTTIGNRLLLGNFTEGYDLKDNQENDIKIDYEVSCISKAINKSLLESDDSGNKQRSMVDGLNLYKKGYTFSIYLDLVNSSDSPSLEGKEMLNESFDFVLPKDFPTLKSIIVNETFLEFVEIVNTFIKSNISNWKLNETDEMASYPTLSFLTIGNGSTIFMQIGNGSANIEGVGPYEVIPHFSEYSVFRILEAGKGQSAKSNRDYEVAIIYEDEFKRATTALTCINNSIYISPESSSSINTLRVSVKHKAPAFAKSYRFAVKSNPLTYENLIISKFYPEDEFVWCKLEGSSKDKVKEGDNLILKKDALKPSNKNIVIPVLEKKVQEKDFIKDNKDHAGKEIIEDAGTYIRIRAKDFVMNEASYKIHQDSKSDSRKSKGHYPDVTLKIDDILDWDSFELPEGSSVYLSISSINYLDNGRKENTFEKTWSTNQPNYTLKKWYNNYLNDKDVWGNKGNVSENYKGKINLLENHKLYIEGTRSASSGGRRGYIDAEIVIRTNTGYYVFETQEKKTIDTGIYYKTSQTFDIENGIHLGNVSNQTGSTPAINDLDFFNCVAFGEGIESYKIKDQFNANYLVNDTGVTTTSTEEYGEIIRYADLTYSEAFVESTGFNGISSFNTSLANCKELDKHNGAIQKLVSREGNVLVYQTDKVGQVMFGKDLMYNADGTTNVAKVPYVLGEYVPYSGEYGMSHPESFEKEGNRCYWVDAKRGYALRLSNNGISPITYGMEGWFKNMLFKNTNSKIVGGYDPYTQLYYLTTIENPDVIMQVNPGVSFSNYQVSEELSYDFELNNLQGVAALNYDVFEGAVTIEAVYNNSSSVVSNVSGVGVLEIPITSVSGFSARGVMNSTNQEQENKVSITITPTTETASYNILHLAPEGVSQKIVEVVINDPFNYGGKVINGFGWGNGPMFYSETILQDHSISKFEIDEGKQGIGKFPKPNSYVHVQSTIESINIEELTIRYLISNKVYSSSNIGELISESEEVLINSNDQKNYYGSFGFFDNGIIYVIYDFGGNIDPVPPTEINSPSDFKVVKTSSTTAYASWTNNDMASTDVYEIYYSIKDSGNWIELNKVTNTINVSQGIDVSNLSEREVYEFRIKAKGYNGNYSDYAYDTLNMTI